MQNTKYIKRGGILVIDIIDKLRTAVSVSAFPELRDPELNELRRTVTRAVTIAALFEDTTTVPNHEGLALARADYESGLVEAWRSSERLPIGPGLIADFAVTERRLRTDAYKAMSSRWGNLVIRGYQEVSSAHDWEFSRAPRIWSDTVRQITPMNISVPEFEATADSRDNQVAELTLRSLTASSLHLEQLAIQAGTPATESFAA